ncbi:MAG: hypothetical protein AB7U29_00435 [Desulfobulbus sp.]
MEFNERDNSIGNVGYDSMVWVRDGNGREFSCTLDSARGGVKSMDDLSAHERASCMNVNEIVGTERW